MGSPPRDRWLRAGAALAGLGATLGVALDGIHSHFGATRYAEPWVWGTAWWVPLLFGGAFTLGLLRPALDRWRGGALHVPTRAAALGAMGAFVAAYWTTVAPLPWPAVTALVLANAAAAWALVDRTARGLAFGLAAAIGGPTVEAVLVARGAFEHLQPLALGLPAWLPALYLSASVGLGALGRRLVAP